MSRPYKGSSTSDLKLLFEANSDNLGILEALLHELGFRRTQSALRLLAQIAERIADLSDEDDAFDGNVYDDNSEISVIEESETPRVNADKRSVSNGNLFGKASQDYKLPPDDVKRPKNLNRIRPPGTPGLPSSSSSSVSTLLLENRSTTVMADELLFTKDDKIATLTLNRPDKLNTFHDGMLADWTAALQECQTDDTINVVVLTGAGRVFCAGGDISTMGKQERNPARCIGDYLRQHVHPVARAVEALKKPYLCALNGTATGAGLDMALMADMRFAARQARFAESYIKVGLIAGDGGAFLLPRLIGLSKALELLWTGDFITAEEAERIGLVSKVFDDDRLMAETYAFAERLANGPSVAIRLMKQAVYQCLRTDFLTALEAITGSMGVAYSTEDHREAVAAFLEKRTPTFKGY